MNTLHHFGDSYATIIPTNNNKHFCEIIANILKINYKGFGKKGLSNEQMLDEIIQNIKNFQKGDIVFINFSFLTRGCYYDTFDNEIKSSNKLYNDIEKYIYKPYFPIHEKEKIMILIDYYTKHTEDYAKKIFKLFNSIIEYLENLEIKIFYIFLDDNDYVDSLLNFGTNIKFKTGFCKWLIENDFHKGTDVHYTMGIQPMLADVIIRKTNNLSNKESVCITIDDIDKTKIIKASKIF